MNIAADFDGDTLNGVIILDKKMYKDVYMLSPHYGVLSLQKPLQVGSNVGMAKPVISTIDNWLMEGRA